MNVTDTICCGCGGCVTFCPENCISMTHSSEGFIVASVDERKCIQCGLCVQKCSQKYQYDKAKSPINSYLAFCKEEKIREKSSSGGIFPVLAETIIDQGGSVYGAAFDREFILRHKSATTKEDITDLCGSKYLQSEAYPVFLDIKELVKSKKVFFVGTPCQVYALKQIVEDADNLYTADLICHGAPSPKLFDGYRKYLEKANGGKILSYNFRSKEHANSVMSYTVKATYQDADNKIHEFYMDGDEEPYTMRFISNALSCEACYQCPFANLDRQGDITLGDYWGYQKVHPEYAHVQGVSLVLVNSQKGKEMLQSGNNFHLVETQEELYLQYNNHLNKPPIASADREKIYTNFANMGFSKFFYNHYFTPKGYRLYLFKRRILHFIQFLRREIN